MWVGLKEFEAKLLTIPIVIEETAKEALVEIASLLEETAKKNATGRPGPEVRTGSLRRGIRQSPMARLTGGTWKVSVGPTMIYSRRVELGYRGTDSLGRAYDTPGYPYFRPAYDDVMLRALEIYRKNIMRVLL